MFAAMADSPISRLRKFAASLGDRKQTQLAKALGMGQPHLSKILRGKLGVGIDEALAFERATKDWEDGPILVGEWEGYEPDRRGDATPDLDDDDQHAESPDETAVTQPCPAGRP